MSMIQFLINNNYSIPRFCYHGLLSIAGNCRVCVIDDREMKTSVSCALCYETYRHEYFNNNAIIGVYVKNALRIREAIFEFLLISHPLDCPICDRGGECELQDMTNSFGSDHGRVDSIKGSVNDKFFSISISTHMSRCISCGRCVRFLREISNSFNLGIVGRGNFCEISSYTSCYDSTNGIYSSNIIDLCPVSLYICKFKSYSEYIYIMYFLQISSMFIKFVYNFIFLSPYFCDVQTNLYFYRLYYSLPVTYSSRKLLDNVYECVLCASCTASCPSYWWNSNTYLGPAVLLQAYRWVVDSKDSDFYNRLSILDMCYNISLCHGIGNCKVVCPKNLDPASRISDLKSILGFKSGVLYYYM